MKNAGSEPVNKAIVVIPKEKHGFFGSFETKIATVTGIVILNSPIPINDKIINELPKSKNGRDNMRLMNEVFVYPI